MRGLSVFYGSGGCATCHSGPLLTDHGFHAMGVPQIGPGKAERFESHQRDIGRMRVTGRPEDAYAFRTPSLRNVTRTGPWGHAGAHDDLASFLRDHAAPNAALSTYTLQAVLPDLPGIARDGAILADPAEVSAIAAAIDVADRHLDDAAISDLMAFLTTLEDPVALGGRLGVPETVPSGLPVEN
jgi:cytochrome c peroxidase